MQLSIVIVNYKTRELTIQCIRSIIDKLSGISYEIILVDNSNDFSTRYFQKFGAIIHVYSSTENIGFGKANNLGMVKSEGDFILLLNSDTLITNSCISDCISFLTENKQFSMIGINQLDEAGQSIVNAFNYIKSFDILNYLFDAPFISFFRKKVLKTDKDFLFKSVSEVKQLSGAFMLLRRQVFEETQGFDPDFFMYYEETEWCSRIREKFKLAYDPNLWFTHLHGKSSERLIMTKQMHYSAGLFWYKKGVFNYIMFLLISYLIYVPNWIIVSIVSTKHRAHFSKYLKIYSSLFYYYLFEIFKYSNGYGQRESDLKLKELK